MTSTELIVIIGGLLLGYWIVSSLFNKKLASSTNTYSDNNYERESQQNRSRHETPNNDNSGEKDYISTSWFHILDVSQDASKEQIISAYKQKISQYHPDKVTQMGAEIRELAEFKSKQINAAYGYAIKLQR